MGKIRRSVGAVVCHEKYHVTGNLQVLHRTDSLHDAQTFAKKTDLPGRQVGTRGLKTQSKVASAHPSRHPEPQLWLPHLTVD